MVKNRIISTLLAVVMLLGAFTMMVSANESEGPVYTYNTSSAEPTYWYFTGKPAVYNDTTKQFEEDKTGEVIVETPQDKIATMDLRLEKDGYRLYVDAYSGEVAVECIASGEILFSNPYDIHTDKSSSANVKSELLSQIKVNFTDVITGKEDNYWSYEWAASRGQIAVKNIKNGVRVEYTIGREQTKFLVPEQIERTSFETKLRDIIATNLGGVADGKDEMGRTKYTFDDVQGDYHFGVFDEYYKLKDPKNEVIEQIVVDMQKTWPITKKMPIYVFDPGASNKEKARVEQYIKSYAPDYTYDDLDEDHLRVEYESKDENPPLFKLALEYTLDTAGVSVRLPANGIRFTESLYRLNSIDILPYMGAGENPNSGYTFFPDGSGALFDFEDIASLKTSTSVSGHVYGVDYAYHDITGTHQEAIRYPVFGIYEDQKLLIKKTTEEEGTGEGETATTTPVTVAEEDEKTEEAPTHYNKKRGFVAIVEEGDALMELTADHAISKHNYNTVRMTVKPRPNDTYNVADSISVGQNDTWTVVSARKYTGSYKVRYIMLTSPEVAEEKGLTGTYDTSYVGMAKAYRDYLINNGVLTKLTSADVKNDIPLYIETFGAMETTERFLSIPFTVMTPLTTFADINTMYDQFAAKGVTNINFIMTGYTKGGMTEPSAPYHLKWDNAVEEGGMKFEDLTAVAKEKGFQIFPDFDFVFTKTNTLFDGVNLKNHAVKTIDDRYTSKREYSATKQTYISYFELALSPAYFSHFYEKLTSKYLEYSPIGISVSTLGSYLNSDFDEDEPYNRSDSRDFTERAFQYIRNNYSKVMTAGGNAFSWKYVDYITDIALDSSRFAESSAAVPFLGIVLHGYVEYAGTAINMEGNMEYALLKALESGAALKFILSYQNTDNLKNDITLSKYYSIRYDIWFEDVVELYSELNSVLKDLQTSTIEVHEFLEGIRIPDADELESDLEDAIEEAIKNEAELTAAKKEALRKKLHESRKLILDRLPDLDNAFLDDDGNVSKYNVTEVIAQMNSLSETFALVLKKDEILKKVEETKADLEQKQEALKAAEEALKAAPDDATLIAAKDAAVAAVTAATEAYTKANIDSGLVSAYGTPEDVLKRIYNLADTAIKDIREMIADYEAAVEGMALLESEKAFTENIRKDLKTKLDSYIYSYNKLAGKGVYTESFEEKVTKIAKDAYVAYAAYIEANKNNSTGGTGSTGTTQALEGTEGNEGTEENETVTPPVEIMEDYVYVEKEEIKEEETTNNTDEFNKYESDTNKIVYTEFVNSENGNVTAFILNFNNYAVSVTAKNGTTYTLEAYGYIVLKPTNA